MKKSGNVKYDKNDLRDACIQRIEEYLQCPLGKRTLATFSSPNRSTAVVCAVATTLTKGEFYWFQFRVSQKEFLEEPVVKKGYIAFGCGSADTLLVISARKFFRLLDQLQFAEARNYWYLQIFPKGDRLVLRPFKKDAKREIDLTELSELGVRKFHPGSAALLDKFLSNKLPSFDAKVEKVDDELKRPSRITQTVRRLERDSATARELKQNYEYKCQVCNTTIELPSGERYAEAHHLRPLGKPHNGKEGKSNTIVVCPQHHAMFDLSVIAIDPKSWLVKHWNSHSSETVLKLTIKHDLDKKSVDYHYKLFEETTKSADSKIRKK